MTDHLSHYRSRWEHVLLIQLQRDQVTQNAGENASKIKALRLWSKAGAVLSEPKLRGWNIPSGKLSHNYGKSPFLMGKSTINGFQ